MLDLIIELAQELKAERMKRYALEEQSAKDRAKVLFSEALEASSVSMLVGDMAKLLRENGVEIGQEGLFKWLREKGYLIDEPGENWNMPTRESLERGLFEVKKTVSHKPEGSTEITRTVKITSKGQIDLVSIFLGKR